MPTLEHDQLRAYGDIFLQDGIKEIDVHLVALLFHLGLAVHLIGDEDHPFLPGQLVGVLGIAVGTHIPVQDNHLGGGIDLLDLQGIFHCGITADLAAVLEIITPGTGTLDHDHRIRGPVLGLAGQAAFQLLLGDHLFHLAEQIFIRPMLPAAGGDDDDPVINGLFRLFFPFAYFDHRGKITDKTIDRRQLGIGHHLDLLMFLHPTNQLLHHLRGIFALQGILERCRMAAQSVIFFNEIAVESPGWPGSRPRSVRPPRRR